MKNKKNQPKEHLGNIKSEENKDALSKDQNDKENRGDLEKINNGIEIDEIDRPEDKK